MDGWWNLVGTRGARLFAEKFAALGDARPSLSPTAVSDKEICVHA